MKVYEKGDIITPIQESHKEWGDRVIIDSYKTNNLYGDEDSGIRYIWKYDYSESTFDSDWSGFDPEFKYYFKLK